MKAKRNKNQSSGFIFSGISPKKFSPFLIFFIIFTLGCLNAKEKFYTFAEANSKVLMAFAAKDQSCGTSHTITSLLPGESQKSDIDSCIKVIQALDCNTWSAANPTPIICTRIMFKIQ